MQGFHVWHHTDKGGLQHHVWLLAEVTKSLFCRTLTPFGFQSEERTLWEATETYINMSPYLQAHKIKKPLLLIHGEDDNNTGTPFA